MNEFSHILIRASAGTGKTFRLSNRYLGLLLHGATPDEIVATTFTRKAAGEILDRVMVRVAEAALQDDKRSQLAKHLQQSALSRDDCLRMLRLLIRQLHRLRVCTLDSLFAQLAGSFTLELELPPGWRIVELVQDNPLRREAITLTLQSGSRREVERLLQLMAKGEARRSVGELLRATVDNLYGLYMETEAAAWQRIPRPPLLAEPEIDAAIERLRAAPLPGDKRLQNARESDALAAQQRDWIQFLSRGMAAKVLDGENCYYKKEIPPETVSIYQDLLAHARAVLLHQVANQTEATYALLDKFHGVYQELKHRARALRFDDITRTLAQAAGAHDIVRQQFRMDASVRHLLLDEFQDTSLSQWRVLRPFAFQVTGDAAAGSRSSHSPASSFFCVGDVKQAIYGWRGGLSEIFDALQSELSELSVESMNLSFRSSPPIIETVNRVFTQMTRHSNLGNLEAGVRQWCEAFEPHATHLQGLQGYAELITAPSAGDEQKQKDIRVRYAAGRIQQWIAEAPRRSVGVLVRSNDAVAHLIYELRQLGVPASEEGGNPLTDSPAVQIVLSLLKLADHPGDTIARYHLATSPLGAALDYTDHEATERALTLALAIRQQLLDEGYGRSVLHWVRLLEPVCDPRDRNRLRQFVEMAYAYQPLATLRTADFLSHVAAQRVADPTTAEVRVMTVHQAKGLQFDIVVLPDLDVSLVGQPPSCVVGQSSPTEPIDRVCLYRNAEMQKLLPPELQELFEIQARRTVNESMCVLYVALTRAIHALHMIVDPSSATEKSLHKKPAGLLRAALTDGQPLEPEQQAYQCGNPRWYEEEIPAANVPAVVPRQARDVSVKLAIGAGEKSLEHTAPSSLEGGARVAGRHVLHLGSAVATARGTLIHALFEEVTWLDDGAPARSRLTQVAARLNCAGLNVQQQLDSFEQMLANPEIAAVLHRDYYYMPRDPGLVKTLGAGHSHGSRHAVVSNERRFAVRDEGRLLAGSIDRLVLLYDDQQLVAADVVDYKTDAIAADDPVAVREAVRHYQPQLEAYRRAVAKMYRLPADRITSRLLMVSCGIVQAVE